MEFPEKQAVRLRLAYSAMIRKCSEINTFGEERKDAELGGGMKFPWRHHASPGASEAGWTFRLSVPHSGNGPAFMSCTGHQKEADPGGLSSI